MSKKSEERHSLKYINRIMVTMLAVYALIVFMTLMLVSYFSVNKTNTVLKNKVISMTSSLSVQMKLNLNEYMSRMETIATLAFGEEQVFTYDATDPNNDEYEAINTEKAITEKMYSLCIMENFVDYGIVYSNNRTVGKISNGTSSLFVDSLYEELEKMIGDSRLQNAWFTGYENDYKRIYYVKRVHENAILFISFYADELDEVFDNPETLSDMEIYLVNEDYNILYSKSGNEIGGSLPDDLKSRIEGKSDVSIMDDEYMISTSKCNEWYVVCSIPTRKILSESNDMMVYIYMTAIIAAIIASAVGFYFSRLLVKPVKNVVRDLDDKATTDMLTDLLNKLTFEDYAATILRESDSSEKRALIILDLDDFKNVNDTMGHAAGDRVLKHMGSVLKRVFSSDDYIGRIGGDEFAVLVNHGPKDDMDYHEYIKTKCEEFMKVFAEEPIFRKEDPGVSASIGIAIYSEDGSNFKKLYAACDKALYISKNSGKNTYTFYNPKEKGGNDEEA